MKIEFKIFIIIICLVLSIPFLFFSWGLIKLEYDELIRFGNVEDATILKNNIEPYTGASAEFGSDYVYDLKIIGNTDLKDKNYSAYLGSISSTSKDKEYEEFISQVKKGDTVQIKILSDHQAKILKWRNLELNQAVNYWEKLGKWIIIVILISVATFLYYKIYKTILK